MTQDHYWDMLALSWIPCERGGMTEISVSPFLNRFHSPVLVVGAGQGLILDNLLQHGFDAVGIDYSTGMIAGAKRRRGLDVGYGKADAIPFPDNFFNTVIIATGVIDIGNLEKVRSAILEARRVSKESGTLIIGLFSPSQDVRLCGQEIGFMNNWRQYQNRLFKIWDAGKKTSRLVELITQWTGCTHPEAETIVLNYDNVLLSIHDEIEKMAVDLREQNLDPKLILQKALNFDILGCSPTMALQLLTKQGLQRLIKNYEPSVSTLTLLGKWE